MPTMSELSSIHLRQLDAVLAESYLLLQREGGLDGELKTSGSLCEQFLKSFLSKYVVPSSFRVTSGYIATPSLLANKLNLPQCDILIIDNHAPPLLRLAESSIEVVPIESVVGIMEAKRTLTMTSLSQALDQLNKLIGSAGDPENFKTDKDLSGYNRYVGFHNSSTCKPLVGIVSLTSSIPNWYAAADLITSKNSLVDFVWSFDGHALLPVFINGQETTHYTHSARPISRTWSQLSQEDFSTAPSSFYKNFSGKPGWLAYSPTSATPREAVLAHIIGILSLTLSRIFPKPISEQQVQGYYLSAR